MDVILKNTTESGELLQAIFDPERGMNLKSFRKGNIEVIDQSTMNLFEERNAGLGAMIGPHFHHRKKEVLPKITDEQLFPHFKVIKEKGIAEPFSHGIGRYVPWQYQAGDHFIKAKLNGKDKWKDVALGQLEGQNFIMQYDAQLYSTGLVLELSVVSDSDSCVGLHYYYHLPNGQGKIQASVQNYYVINGQKVPLPENWNYTNNLLSLDLNKEADFTFYPFPNVCEGKILLKTEQYQLATTYTCDNQENCWQLYHPQGSSFVCIEPISAKDPRHPILSVSSLKIHLQIL